MNPKNRAIKCFKCKLHSSGHYLRKKSDSIYNLVTKKWYKLFLILESSLFYTLRTWRCSKQNPYDYSVCFKSLHRLPCQQRLTELFSSSDSLKKKLFSFDCEDISNNWDSGSSNFQNPRIWWKILAASLVVNSLLNVWKCDKMFFLVWNILLQETGDSNLSFLNAFESCVVSLYFIVVANENLSNKVLNHFSEKNLQKLKDTCIITQGWNT